MNEKQTQLAIKKREESTLGDLLLDAHQAEVDREDSSRLVSDAYGKFQRGEISGAEYSRITDGAAYAENRFNMTHKAVDREMKRSGHRSVKQRLASFIMHH